MPESRLRVVSLCPSLTELVFALGRGDWLVGRTKFCVHPEPQVQAVEKVGGTKNPHVERIVELQPDLVLMNEEENRREDAEALQAAGVRIHACFPRDVWQTARAVAQIGAELRAQPRADAIAQDVQRRAQRVADRARLALPVSFAYLIWQKPWMGVANDTYVDALLTLAGGRNVLAGAGTRYPVVELGGLAAAKPDTVLLSSEPFPFKMRHRDELVAATGISPQHVLFVDGELLSWHGSRTPEGIDYAWTVLDTVRRGGGKLTAP